MPTITVEEYRKLTKKRHKYGAVRTEYGGRWYASKAEANYAAGLDSCKRAGALLWEPQYPFVLHAPSGHAIGKYVSDFKIRYTGSSTVEHYIDVKGYDTPLSKWKRKHAELEYGIKIEVVKL